MTKVNLLNHIPQHFDGLKTPTAIQIIHIFIAASLAHIPLNSTDETRSNCVNRKRKWHTEPEIVPEDNTQAHPEVLSIQESSNIESPHEKGKTASSEEVQIAEKLMINA